jgi:hypothetical protein
MSDEGNCGELKERRTPPQGVKNPLTPLGPNIYKGFDPLSGPLDTR